MEIKRFIFDLDGTLLTGDFSKEKAYFEDVYKDESSKLIGKIGDFLNVYENTHPRYDVDVLSEYLTMVSGLRFTPSIIRGWIEVMKDPNDRLEEGVIDTLEYLKSSDKSLAVLTNWFGDTQVARLKSNGIYEYFDSIYTGDTVLKPHKAAYLSARGLFMPEECVVIGDHVDRDYIGPRACGMESVLYDPYDKSHKSIVKVKRIDELKKRY